MGGSIIEGSMTMHAHVGYTISHCGMARPICIQGHSQDFSRGGGSVCGNFANHTHFKIKNHAHYLQTKSHSVQQLGCFIIIVAHKRVAS